MRNKQHVTVFCRWLPRLLCLVAAGCNGSAELSSPAANRLRTLTNAYLDYAVAKGAGPASEAVLLAHLRNVPGFLLEAGGITPNAGAAALVSERDGQPFLIQYGVGVAFVAEAPPIACERAGKDGTRLIAFANGKIDCMDDVAAMELMQIKTRSEAAERPSASQASVFGNIEYARR